MESDAHLAVTPMGSPLGVPIPEAPVILCVISVKAVLIHNVGVEEAPLTLLKVVTVIVPVALTRPQPPVKRIL